VNDQDKPEDTISKVSRTSFASGISGKPISTFSQLTNKSYILSLHKELEEER